MQIQLGKSAGVAVMAVSGRMDAMSSREFDLAFDGLLKEKTPRVVLNMAELAYISSAGLRSVLAAGKKIKEAKGRLALCNLAGMVKEVFEISGFSVMLPLFQNEEAAIKSLS